MSCPGLHCGGCAGGAAVPPVALACIFGAVWVAEHIVEVLITSAVCGVLAVAAVVALMRWGDRRDARRAAEWRMLAARTVPAVASAQRPALGFRDLHIHIDGQPSAEQVAVLRQAINGRTP